MQETSTLVGCLARMSIAGIEAGVLATTVGMDREESAAEVSEDTLLVSAAQAGDRSAFGRLYERYARMVHGILLGKVPSVAADDLTQDVFLKALQRLSTLRAREKFGAWLAAIARNMATDYHRNPIKEDSLDDQPDEGGLAASPTSADGEAAAVLKSIRRLPEAYRETLILRLVEGMTGPEIAAHTGLTPGSVRVNLHRGMQQLRAQLASPSREIQPEEERP